MPTIDINVADLEIVQQFKEPVVLSRTDPDNNNRLTEIEQFDAAVLPNTSPSNRLEQTGQVINRNRYFVIPVDNTAAIKRGDIITRADGETRLFVNETPDLKGYETLWLECDTERIR